MAPPQRDRSLVDCYEELRRRALTGQADGHQLGLAVLLRHGVAAWLHAWQELPAAPAAPAPPPAGGDQLVSVLATMALALVRGG